MSKISGGLGRCFDAIRRALPDGGLEVYMDAARALDSIEEAFQRRQRWAEEARRLAMRFNEVLETEVAWLRQGKAPWSAELQVRANQLDTQRKDAFYSLSIGKMPHKALVELGVAVAAELERRGITAFPVVLGGDGKIQGGVSEDG